MKRPVLLTALTVVGALAAYFAAYRYTYRTGGFVPYLNQTLGRRLHCSFDWIQSAFLPARSVDEFPKRSHWRRSIRGLWRAQSSEFGIVVLQLDSGPGDSLRVIRATNCPFFQAGDYTVSFPAVPIVSDSSFYRNFTRLDDQNLWIDVLSRKLGWTEAKPFEFTRIQ